MSKTAYVTLVTLTCYIDGLRVDVPPGQPVPDGIAEHDIENLLKMRAIKDPLAEEQQQAGTDAATAKAQQEYEAARRAVQAADASLVAGKPAETKAEAEAETESAPAPTPAAKKTTTAAR